MHDKARAYEVLVGLERHLNEILFVPIKQRTEVSAIWNKPKAEKSPTEKLHAKENIFLYHFALPEIYKYILTIDGIDEEIARRALRGEYFAKFPHLLSANARRAQGHPFEKNYPFEENLEEDVKEVMARWKAPVGTEAPNKAHPDLALAEPFPVKILFEAKYFEVESLASAEAALVTGVYEATYYRGLPAPSPEYPQCGWSYDFACLLAFDATEGAYLREAWNSVTSKRLFWDYANVYVMILRGQRLG